MKKNIIPAVKSLQQLLKYKVLGKKIPLVLSILVTNRCNFDCAFCWADPASKAMKDMPYEEIERIIDDFYNIGTRVIWIQGGEPLLRRDIGKIVDHIKSKGIFCEIVTNGWLAEEKMDVLVNTDKVCFSIEGDRETHDKMRHKGSHEKIISALKKGKELGVNFRLHTVLNKNNMNKRNIDYLCDLAEEMQTGVSFTYALLPVQKLKAGRDNSEHYFERKSLQDTLKYILKCKREGRPIEHTKGVLERVINWNLPFQEIMYRHNAPKGYPQCLYGRLVAYLDADGTLYPCTKYFRYEDKGASVGEKGAEGAWKHVSDLDCVECDKLSELGTFLSINPIKMLSSLKDYLK